MNIRNFSPKKIIVKKLYEDGDNQARELLGSDQYSAVVLGWHFGYPTQGLGSSAEAAINDLCSRYGLERAGFEIREE